MPGDDVENYLPSRRVRASIGDVILAAAKMDHLISMALFKIANVHFAAGFVLTGRMMAGSKIEKLKFLVGTSENIELTNKFDALEQRIRSFFKLRNTIAHGVIMGEREGDICFLMTSDYLDNDGMFVSSGEFVPEHMLHVAAQDGIKLNEEISQIFDVRPLPDTEKYILREEKPKSRRSMNKNIP